MHDRLFPKRRKDLPLDPKGCPAAVFHNHGRYLMPYTNRGIAYFPILSRRLFHDSLKKDVFHKPDDLEIILCHNYESKPIAASSLDYLGIHDYVELGSELEPWLNYMKIPLVLDHLKRNCNAEYILVLDAADVILTADPVSMLECFQKEFDCGVLFNAAKDSFPGSSAQVVPIPLHLKRPGVRSNSDNFDRVPESDIEKCVRVEAFEAKTYGGPFCHLNAGCYIGRRKDVVDMLLEAESLKFWFETERYRISDQGILREVHRRYFPRFQIDSKCRIFQTLHNIERWELASESPITHFEENLYRLDATVRTFLRRLRLRVQKLWAA